MTDPDDRSLPVLAGPFDHSGDRSSVLGVVLAAGTSSRFNEANKLLATLDGEPLVRQAARSLLDAGLGVTVVLGYEAEAVREPLAGVDVEFVENPDYREGQSTSVHRGVEAAVDRNASAVLFLPGDMPFVAPGTVGRLVDAYLAGAGTALAVAHDGRRGNPVLFDQECFDALRAVEGDTGGRSVLLGHENAALVTVEDSGVRQDVDTRSALERHRGG